MPQSVHRRASWWLLRLQSDDATEADRVRFEAWYTADPRHAAAFDALVEVVQDVRLFKRELAVYAVDRSLPRKPPRAAIVGASLALAAAAALGFIWLREPAPQLYATEIGAQRDLTLADGSVVELNTDTRIDVRFSPAARRVRMERGEALFRVAHNPDRPFEVEAGGNRVRAVGTAFVVRVAPEALNVLVTEGAVSVARTPARRSSAAKASGRRVRLAAGQALDLTERGSVVAEVTAEDIRRSLAWRDGMLRFAGEPLRDAVKEVARYTGVRFVIADPALENLHVVAYVRAADLDGFVAMLERSFPDLIARRSGDQIRIERRAERSDE